jgi:PilZ domain
MEHRNQSRTRLLKSARIVFNHHQSVIDCTVRNLSSGGACLSVPGVLGIPENFELMFEWDKSVRQCRMVWHKERQIGVAFAPAKEQPTAARAA